VPGYHLHLLSDDHQQGGHVLDLHCCELKVVLHREDELHLALPETPDFMKADLHPHHLASPLAPRFRTGRPVGDRGMRC